MSPGRRIASCAAIFLAIAVVGWLDSRVGPRLSFSLFYLVPVVAAGWFLGLRTAIAAAMAAGLAWLLADLRWRTGGEAIEIAWNATVRLATFTGFGWITARLRAENERLLTANERLRVLAEREAIHARSDALTGLPNWHGFNEHLEREIARSRRRQEPLAIAYVDLDNFKSINDTRGHDEGNTALRLVADAVRGSVRATDVAARTGGDEFVVLLPAADSGAALTVAERIVAEVHQVGTRYPGCNLGASVGVACASVAPKVGDPLLRAADAAMYEAKHTGKGRVVVVEAEPGDGASPTVSASA
jgi:diguanylate cyclase (GGDEF)-like protein